MNKTCLGEEKHFKWGDNSNSSATGEISLFLDILVVMVALGWRYGCRGNRLSRSEGPNSRVPPTM